MSAMAKRSKPSRRSAARWWARPGLDYIANELCVAGQPAAEWARAVGTPLYLYDGARILANLERLRAALAVPGLRFRVFYAMKSNRYAPLLAWLRQLGGCGIDACSPGEVRRARARGFAPSNISFTGTSLSDADLRELLRHEGLILNLDSRHDIQRVGALAPGRRVGLRINPGLGLGYRHNRLLRYAGGRGTKFGLHREQFPAALRAARAAGLVVEGLHFHTGCGYLTPQLPALGRIFAACQWFIARAPAGLRYVNLGGGLGVPLVPGDQSLDLAAWSKLVAQHFGGRDFEVWCEPGDFLVKDAGVLVLEVNTVERKGRTLYTGVNGGFTLHPEPAFYRLPLWPVPCRQPASRTRLRPTTLAGNINEALDLLHVDAPLPPLANRDLIALLNAGGYGAAMASNHCLRGTFNERLLLPPVQL
jgi:diaminopimelate decarboxylase